MPKKETLEIYPTFRLGGSRTDLMIRGGDFYAIWDKDKNAWSMDEGTAIELIDKELDRYREEHKAEYSALHVKTLYMWDADSGSIDRWHKYVQKQSRDWYQPLDEELIFANTETTKESYASKRLAYPLEDRPIPAWEELVGTLYSPKEKMKLEWAIGAVVSGDSKRIQKFVVMYGAPKTGKSTVLNIIQKLFDGYCGVFDAKTLGSSSNAFALEAFRNNPLIAIQHDGDLSHIEDNTRLNSLVSHEMMTVNEKFKAAYTSRFNTFLFMGTNKPVKITDAKSGIIRRLIDISPSGNRVPTKRYNELMSQIDFELGGIAKHCLDIYNDNKHLYDEYVPVSMMGASNTFYNFVQDNYTAFKDDDGISLTQAWKLWGEYKKEADIQYPYPKMIFKEELKSYFREFHDRYTLKTGKQTWNYYEGFLSEKFEMADLVDISKEAADVGFPLDAAESLFDKEFADCPAQYANAEDKPTTRWADVTKNLRDISTNLVHYVNIPEERNVVCIDFDLKDENGNKCFRRNAEEARKWPATYAELSKGGEGIHLIYYYNGDASKLSAIYSPNVEVKTFTGGQSLRRRLSKCNDIPIATLSTGLPLKEEKPVIDWKGFKSQEQLAKSIARNLLKKNEPHCTKCSIDYIFNDLESAYNSGLSYDLTPMRPDVKQFALKSTNNADYCMKVFRKMKFKSADIPEEVTLEADMPARMTPAQMMNLTDEQIEKMVTFYDVEVYSNLFVVVYKPIGKKPVALVNPTANDIETLCNMFLVGFNNRNYDNHILYARMLKYSNEQLFDLSQKIIGDSKNAKFNDALHLSYTDIFDFASTKQSLKKWEIEMANRSRESLVKSGYSEEEIAAIMAGGHHQEMGIPWDQPVPEEMISKVVEYCTNDVVATEGLWHYLKADWTARKILASLADASVNDTTNSLTTKIIFGKERHPKLVYTNLATGEQEGPADQCETRANNAFPGYFYGKLTDYYRQYPEYLPEGTQPEDFRDDISIHNMYRGTDLGFGGYVYAEPGMWWNDALVDVASLHPNSIRAMNCFGEYTKNFTDILDARVFIKHKDYETARTLFGGRLAPYLDDPKIAKALSQALKIAINSVYGLTSAKFDNPFKDARNVNNIVALRGALFMRTLQDEVVKRGYSVAHIKTDSIKIPNADKAIVDFCFEFAKQYGYTFEHEATYEKMCLVNDAVYIAKYASQEYCQDAYGYLPEKNADHPGEWTATGTQFQVPYVFKSLFSKEPVLFEDKCETKSVKTALYLDMNENLPEGEHQYQFVGKVGQFCPIRSRAGGGELVAQRVDKKTGETKYPSATGAKGYRWLESEYVRAAGLQDAIDESYYISLVDAAKDTIRKYGDFEIFAS